MGSFNKVIIKEFHVPLELNIIFIGVVFVIPKIHNIINALTTHQVHNNIHIFDCCCLIMIFVHVHVHVYLNECNIY